MEVSVPASFSEEPSVYSIRNGAVTKLDSSFSDGKVVFRTGPLSTYVIGTKPVPQHSFAIVTEGTKVSVGGGAYAASYSGTFAEGTKVSLSAQPDVGRAFVGYYVDGSLVSSDPMTEYTVSSDVVIRAVSEVARHEVKLSGDDCVLIVNGRNVGVLFDERLEAGTHVQAYAVATDGHVVSGWSGTVRSDGPVCDFIVEGPVEAKAVTEAAPNGTVEATVRLVLSGAVAEDYGSIVVDSKEVGTEYRVTLETGGEPAEISVVTAEGYLFDGWNVEGKRYPSRTLALHAGSVDIEAVGVVVPAPTHTIRVVADGGTVYMDGEAADSKEVREGMSVVLSQVPDEGCRFVGWFFEGGFVSASEHYNVIMGASDVVYEARYSRTIHDVVLTAVNATLVVDGVGYGDSYRGTVAEGGETTFEAVPADGFMFDGWIMNGEPYSSRSLTVKGVSADIVATAKAVPLPICTVSVSISNGTVQVDGEDVGSSAAVEVRQGQNVTVKANPADGYAFRYWMSDGRILSSKAEYSFSAPGDISLVAMVESSLRDVTVRAAGGGLIIGSVDVGSEYSTKLYPGEEVIVNAAPDPGYTFSHWDVNGTLYSDEYQSIRIVMGQSDILAVAYMAPVDDSVIRMLAMNGRVVADGEDRGSLYSVVASAGREYVLEAVPDDGYHFDHWTVDGKARYDQRITVSTDGRHVNASAVMEKNESHRLSVSIGNGVLYLDGEDKGSAINVLVDDGAVVSLSARPDPGYALTGWYEGSEPVFPATEYRFRMVRDVSLVADTVPAS